MRYINMNHAEPGMIVGKSIYNEDGHVLVNYRVTLTEKLIKRMKDKGLKGLYIEDSLSDDIEVESLITDGLEIKAAQALREMDIDAAMDVLHRLWPPFCFREIISLSITILL